ncbi:MAG: hypothetical protein ACI4D6_02215 [Chordicoccus sp.]
MSMRKRMLAMFVCGVVLLSGCGSTSPHTQKTDGVTMSVGQGQTSTDSGAAAATAAGSEAVAASSAPAAAQQELKLVETGYYIDAPSAYSPNCYVTFCAKVTNPNKDLAAYFPTVTATAKADDGSILGTEDQTGMYIMPGDTVVLSNMMDTGTSVPSTIDFTLKPASYVPASTVNAPSSSEFTIDNVSEVPSTLGTKVTGQVTYNGTQSCDQIGLTAVYKQGGQIVYAATTYVSSPVVGTPTAFEINPLDQDIPAHDAIEVSAQYWG